MDELLEKCAKDLPEGFIIALNVERGAAWVNLEDPDGFSIQYPTSPDSAYDEQIEEALAFAIEFAKKHP